MMKSMTMTLLATLIAATSSQAAPSLDENACRAGYSIMLLTQSECKTWLTTRSTLEKSGKLSALKQLDENMHALMAERAETCPCAWDQALKAKQLQKNAGF